MMSNRIYSSVKANVVESLKRMLLSRNTQEQLKAAGFIVESMQKFENNPVVFKVIIEHYIVNDLCNFLCEASATLQVELLRYFLLFALIENSQISFFCDIIIRAYIFVENLVKTKKTSHVFFRNILKCLNIFSSSPIFYKKSYSPQVVTSIIRTIQFLVKENGSENIIDHALRFLSEIFFG